jgi:hypothetical protein
MVHEEGHDIPQASRGKSFSSGSTERKAAAADIAPARQLIGRRIRRWCVSPTHGTRVRARGLCSGSAGVARCRIDRVRAAYAGRMQATRRPLPRFLLLKDKAVVRGRYRRRFFASRVPALARRLRRRQRFGPRCWRVELRRDGLQPFDLRRQRETVGCDRVAQQLDEKALSSSVRSGGIAGLNRPASIPPIHDGSGKRHFCSIKVILLSHGPALRFVSSSYRRDRGQPFIGGGDHVTGFFAHCCPPAFCETARAAKRDIINRFTK